MKLEDRFRLAAPVERVWEVLNDIELISPYVPGFTLEESDGDVFRGIMKVKLGAVVVEYDSELTVAERDRDALAVVLRVAGKERRGSGKMKATVTSQLAAVDDLATDVSLETDLQLAGKIAQMGRGMIADVSGQLIRDFVRELEAKVLTVEAADRTAGGGPDHPESPAGATAQPPAGSDTVDLTGAAGAAAARRLGPPLLAIAALAALAYLFWGR